MIFPAAKRFGLLLIGTFSFAPVVCSTDTGDALANRLHRTYEKLDRDADGKLSAEELASQPRLKRLDGDGDGAVTLDEARAILGALLTRESDPGPAVAPPPPWEFDDSPRQAPKRLKASECGVGQLVSDVSFTDLDGDAGQLSTLLKDKPLVVALVSLDCPVSRRYLPTLAQMEKDYSARGVAFLLVAPTRSDRPDLLRAALHKHGLRSRCVVDVTGKFAQILSARATTDVFLLDGARTLVYRGAIDDQYGLGYSLEAPRQRYLVNALEALLEGRTPEIAATAAPGCILEDPQPPSTENAMPTYHGRISRILQANCVECHRQDGVAPFPLENYEQVSAKAGMIRRMVERGLMPPWFAAPAPAGASTPWVNDRSLPDREKDDLISWLDAGKPAGDPADAPRSRSWPREWQIGTPDAILQIPQPLEVNATGVMPYQHAIVDTSFAEERWVRGFEVQPTARQVVHHVLVLVQEKGRKRPAQDGELGGFFAAYVPGNNAIVYPSGFAKSLPAGARLVFQIHYTPNGTATRDQVRLGLLFSEERPAHEVHIAGIANHRLSIPPGAENHPVTATIPVPRSVRLLAFMPHMHVRGKAFRYELVQPDGEARTLLEVPRYDFNWQLSYRYAEPPLLPAGSRVRATGWFDNSANNPANPDPQRTVPWGPQTSDEMMLGYVEYYFEDALQVTSASRPGANL